MKLSQLGQAALQYSEKLNWSIFPVKPRSKNPPLVKWTQCQNERYSPAEIHQIWIQNPNANIGLACGDLSGIVVVDIDSQEGMEIYKSEFGEVHATISQKSGKPHARHLLFKHPRDGSRYKNTVKSLQGIDTRGDGGYILLSPSIHPSGARYEWIINPLDMGLDDLMDLPEELGPLFKQTEIPPTRTQTLLPSSKPDEWLAELLKGVKEPGRNDATTKIVGHYLGIGMPPEEVWTILNAWNARNIPPLAEKELRNTWESIVNRDQGKNEKEEGYIQQINKKHAMLWVGSKYMVLGETWDPVLKRPEIRLSNVVDFHHRFANETVTVTSNGKVKKKSISKIWYGHKKRRQYEGLIFAPETNVDGYYNLWRGWGVQPVRGKWDLYRSHLLDVICSGSEDLLTWHLAWMADCVQNPAGRRKGTAIVYRGGKGTGKGVAARNFGEIFGSHFVHISNQLHVTSRFNSHFKDCLLAFIDEAFWAGDKAAEGVLKALISEDYVVFEAKFKDPIQLRNHVNIIMASNYDWVIPASFDERRFFVLDVSDHCKGNFNYFRKIQDQMGNGGQAALLYDLMHYEIDPETNLSEPPNTLALQEQKKASMNSVQEYWFDSLEIGTIMNSTTSHWPDEILCVALHQYYQEWARERSTRYIMGQTAFGRELRRMCPGVKRFQRAIEGRPRFYSVPSLEEAKAQFTEVTKIEFENVPEIAAKKKAK